MMYLKLMKVFFKENLAFKRILGTDLKSSKIKTILIILAIIYGFGAVLLGFGFMFFELGKALVQMDYLDLLLDFVFIYATFLSTFFILFRANGYLFHYKDYDILAPLPIKNKTVILAKMTVMLTFIYLSVFVIVAPIVFSYFYYSGFDVIKLLQVIVLLLMVPLIPLAIFSFVSLLIAGFSSRFRIGKALNIILMFAFFLGFMFLSMSSSFSETNPMVGQMGLMENISKYLITSSWFKSAIHEGNIWAFLGMIGLSLAVVVIFIFVVEKLVIKTNQMGLTTRTSKNNKQVVSKSRNILVNIIAKEFKKFFSVTIYVFNSGFGPIMMAIGGIAILFLKEDLIAYIDVFEGLGLSFEPMLLLIIGFMMSTVFTSSISLSLEGKNFWILKTLPIKAETVMFGKMIFNVLLTLPVAFFALFMAGIALEINFLNLVVMLLYIATLAFLGSILGSIINLHFPKFNYINETEVVKQSLGALLGMFATWLVLTVNGLLYYYLNSYFDFALLMIFNILINTLAFCGAFYYIKSRAQVIFNKL